MLPRARGSQPKDVSENVPFLTTLTADRHWSGQPDEQWSMKHAAPRPPQKSRPASRMHSFPRRFSGSQIQKQVATKESNQMGPVCAHADTSAGQAHYFVRTRPGERLLSFEHPHDRDLAEESNLDGFRGLRPDQLHGTTVPLASLGLGFLHKQTSMTVFLSVA